MAGRTRSSCCVAMSQRKVVGRHSGTRVKTDCLISCRRRGQAAMSNAKCLEIEFASDALLCTQIKVWHSVALDGRATCASDGSGSNPAPAPNLKILFPDTCLLFYSQRLAPGLPAVAD